MNQQIVEELRLLKLGLPLKATLVLDLLLGDIGRLVSQAYILQVADCTEPMLRNYIKLLRQHGCQIKARYGQGYMLERLPISE